MWKIDINVAFIEVSSLYSLACTETAVDQLYACKKQYQATLCE